MPLTGERELVFEFRADFLGIDSSSAKESVKEHSGTVKRGDRYREVGLLAAVTATTRMIGASQVSTGHNFRRLDSISTGY